MRTNNSVKNISFLLMGQMMSIVVTFLARMVFVKTLGAEYLGVNGLFSNILSVLSLAEMGFGTAIVFNLYKPLADKDENKINALMNFYSNTYRTIGILVLCLGLSLLPFLFVIIKGRPDIPNIRLLYTLFLLNTVITYFYAHKRSFIIADQKSYLSTNYKYIFFLFLNIVQVVILYLTRNFILFLLVQIIFSYTENLFLSRRVDKHYPFLKRSKRMKLDRKSRNRVKKNVGAMIFHKIGGVVVNGTDNILISSFVGIYWVGLYSNYYLIITALNAVTQQIFSSVSGSVGNLTAIESKEKSFEVYKIIFFANFWIVGFCSIALWILFKPFIVLWLGRPYLLNGVIVFFIVVNYYISGMRTTVLMFRDALGLFWNDRYKPMFESIINVAVAVLLLKHFGLVGVFIGTFCSTVSTGFWVEPLIVYKHGFGKGLSSYFWKYTQYTCILLVAGFVTELVCHSIRSIGFIGFIEMLLIVIFVPNIIFTIAFYKTTEFKYLTGILKKCFGRQRIP